jgi:hypothetical protein
MRDRPEPIHEDPLEQLALWASEGYEWEEIEDRVFAMLGLAGSRERLTSDRS